MIAEGLGMPPLPSMNDTVGGLSFQCSSCGKNVANATAICDNKSCPNPAAKKIVKPKNKPDEKGKNPFLQQHERVYKGMPVTNMHVPGSIPIAAQVNPTQLQKPMIPQTVPSVKPIVKNRKQLSDDDAQVVDPSHLSNCEHSADHLGL